VNHKILLSKLEFYGTRWFKYDPDYLCVNKSQFAPVIFEPPCISGSMHKLLKSYLEGRFQRISLQSKHHNLNIHSEWGEILHGVPQGSILASILFLIYINNLPMLLKMILTSVLFAGDTSVIINNPDP
jgi:hypothetical protein